MKLLFNALIKFFMGLILTGILLFAPAGCLNYPNGWLLIGILFLPMFIFGLFMLAKAPGLLEKRLNIKETEKTQKAVVAAAGFLFFAGFVVAGLDYRFGWSDVPDWVVIVASVVFLISYALYAEVVRENAYLSRTIEVQENQRVVDTGLYGIVRHPMYFATVFLFLAMPVILGSWVSFVIFLAYPFIIAKRIRYEEAVLERELKGYKEYKNKVKYRMIPFIW